MSSDSLPQIAEFAEEEVSGLGFRALHGGPFEGDSILIGV